MALSKEQIKNLKVGQTLKLTFLTPEDDSYIQAKVVVVTIGRAACMVKVIEILDRGPVNMTSDDDQYAALFSELDVIPD